MIKDDNKPNSKSDSELLYEALVKEGNKDQADLIPEQFRNITKGDFIAFLNNDKIIPEELEQPALEISEIRRRKGQDPYGPWPDVESRHIKKPGDNMGGGVW